MNKGLRNLLSLIVIVLMWVSFAILTTIFPFVIPVFITIGFILLAIAFVIATVILLLGLGD